MSAVWEKETEEGVDQYLYLKDCQPEQHQEFLRFMKKKISQCNTNEDYLKWTPEVSSDCKAKRYQAAPGGRLLYQIMGTETNKKHKSHYALATSVGSTQESVLQWTVLGHF